MLSLSLRMKGAAKICSGRWTRPSGEELLIVRERTPEKMIIDVKLFIIYRPGSVTAAVPSAE